MPWVLSVEPKLDSLTLQLLTDDLDFQGGCLFVALLLHYLFLSAFCWMLCEGIMLYLLLVVVFSKMARHWWLFLLIGYGLYIIIIG